MSRFARLLLAALAFTGVSGGAGATDSAHFAPAAPVADRQLPLRGTGVLNWGLFFRVYSAALYAPPVDPAGLLAEGSPRRLEIAYFVDIEARQMTDFATARLQEQLGDSAWQRLAPRVREWHAAFRTVRPGDRYVMAYDGEVLTLSLNDRLLARHADGELAAAYFGLWLGDRPIDAGLRAALLGETTDRDG